MTLVFCCIIKNTLSLTHPKKEIITSVSELWQDVSQLFHCEIQQTSTQPPFSAHQHGDVLRAFRCGYV